ncbi:type VII secretion system-associated protein [Lentzea sp. NPDC042327]|uniref:type VII secretion system-associated protein n=1 Tax=Lentzea sp. NPDC042327 TaxID=3154801 RepID=UPI0033EAA42B
MYVLTHPVRVVPVVVEDPAFAGVVEVSTRTHMSAVIAPGPVTGPVAEHVPLTGHNVVLRVRGAVVVERVGIAQVLELPLDADGVSLVHNHHTAPLTPDFVEEVVRSGAAYAPLAAPDVEVDLDRGTTRGLDGATTLPLRVAAGEVAELVLAPVTNVVDLVRWTLVVHLRRGEDTAAVTAGLAVTAETSMGNGATGERAAVQVFYPDHWHRGATREDVVARQGAAEFYAFAAHLTADGSGFVRFPELDGDPEPAEATRLCAEADRIAEEGDRDAALAAYTAAAEAGSGAAAFRLGHLADVTGAVEDAVRWYTLAARRQFRPAFNDLAALYNRLGRLDEAEHWYRRAVEVGDWVAVSGLGVVLVRRGAPEAEAVLRMAMTTPAGEAMVRTTGDEYAHRVRQAAAVAAGLLGDLLVARGRVDEAAEVLREAVRGGNALAAHSLGQLHHDRGDLDAARRWWRESAEAGFPLSAHHLGRLAEEEGDAAEAELWWRRAAAALPATLTRGTFALDGEHGVSFVIGDLAESGEVLAAYALGIRLRYRGEAEEGGHWLRLAARAGHQAARYELSDEPDWTQVAEVHLLEPHRLAVRQDGWYRLPDPGWTAGAPVPVDALVGAYAVDGDGGLGPFQPNPLYVPQTRALPTDPVHALLRRVLTDETAGARLLGLLAGTVVEIATDERGHLRLLRSPDGRPCVAVVTAELHKRRLPAVRWHRVVGDRLAEVVPDEVEILLNPGDTAQLLLLTAALRP